MDFDFTNIASRDGKDDPHAQTVIILHGPPIVIYGQHGGPTVTFRPLKQVTGKFYYELKAVNGGILQIGWADDSFKSDLDSAKGCGDDAHSWAYDGGRGIKWNANKKQPYGCKWNAGDVIGMAADLDTNEIRFSLNGSWESPMGVAFEGISREGGMYPCVTLMYGQRVEIFLGSQSNPFVYTPPEGFNPLKIPVVESEPNEKESKYAATPEIVIQLSLLEKSTVSNFSGCMLVTQMRFGLIKETTKNAMVRHGYEVALKKLQDQNVIDYAKLTKCNDDEMLSIITYTLEDPPIYNYFNYAGREGKISANFPIIFHLLSEACKKILQLRMDSGEGNKTTYRGMSIQCKADVGQIIRFGSFTSTTGDLEIAKSFQKGHGTLFVIESKLGASIKEISAFPEEEEVLIPPYEKFRVERIDELSSTMYLASELTDEYVEQYLKEYVHEG